MANDRVVGQARLDMKVAVERRGEIGVTEDLEVVAQAIRAADRKDGHRGDDAAQLEERAAKGGVERGVAASQRPDHVGGRARGGRADNHDEPPTEMRSPHELASPGFAAHETTATAQRTFFWPSAVPSL
ncbi:MAG: hypothetical protein ABSF69_18460 [Polyangiaceae bacterium]